MERRVSFVLWDSVVASSPLCGDVDDWMGFQIRTKPKNGVPHRDGLSEGDLRRVEFKHTSFRLHKAWGESWGRARSIWETKYASFRSRDELSSSVGFRFVFTLEFES